MPKSGGNMPKVSRVRLRNVRSWPTLDLPLAPGLTVIVGESDSGKSNIVRAVRAVCENDRADDFLSAWADAGEAVIEFTDGVAVALRKSRGGVNRYTIKGGPDAGVFSAVGSGVPDAVLRAVRLAPVSIAGDVVQLHVAMQRGAVLIADDSPGRVARLLGAASGLGPIYRGAHWLAGEGRKAAAEAERAAGAARGAAAGVRAAAAGVRAAGVAAARAGGLLADLGRGRRVLGLLRGAAGGGVGRPAPRGGGGDIPPIPTPPNGPNAPTLAFSHIPHIGEVLNAARGRLARADGLAGLAGRMLAAARAVADAEQAARGARCPTCGGRLRDAIGSKS